MYHNNCEFHNQPHPLGLKLKLLDSDCSFHSFTYSLFPTMEKSLPVSWQYLATEDIKSDNIRCHHLQPGDTVAELLNEFRKNCAKAVVLINTVDNYQLSQEFVVGVPQLTFPVVVVKQTDGDKILKCFKFYSGEVHARVDAENLMDDMDLTGRNPIHKNSNAAESLSKPLPLSLPFSDQSCTCHSTAVHIFFFFSKLAFRS